MLVEVHTQTVRCGDVELEPFRPAGSKQVVRISEEEEERSMDLQECLRARVVRKRGE